MKCIYSIFLIGFFLLSCKSKSNNAEETVTEPPLKPKTTVIVAYPSDSTQLNNNITLNATATYLLKSDVKANSTGYITKVRVKLADYVSKGSVLFGLETKEARSLGNTINQLDKSFRFNGNTTVISPASGYIAVMNHQIGDYVQDGEVLATITDANSFGFVVDVPYEYLQLIKVKNTLSITLPGGKILQGKISKIMPSVDAISQTVKVLLQVSDKNIPENLIGTVSFSTSSSLGLSVPKMAVLSNETQSSFWVMKLINDSTAVKTEIEKGIETDQNIQIKSGDISTKDRVIISGNFGLSDTARVQIQKP